MNDILAEMSDTNQTSRTDGDLQQSCRKAPPPASPSAGALSDNAVKRSHPSLRMIAMLPSDTTALHTLRLQVGLLQAAVFESGRARLAAPTNRELNQQLTGVHSPTTVYARLISRSSCHSSEAQSNQHQGGAGQDAAEAGTARSAMQGKRGGKGQDVEFDQTSTTRSST